MKGNEKKMKGKWKELKIAPQNCEPPCANFSKKILMKISALAKHPDLLRIIVIAPRIPPGQTSEPKSPTNS